MKQQDQEAKKRMVSGGQGVAKMPPLQTGKAREKAGDVFEAKPDRWKVLE